MCVGKIDKVTFGGAKKLYCCRCSNILALLHVLLNGFYFFLKCYFSFIPIRDSSICSMRFECLLITKIVRSMMRPSTTKWTLKILWSHDFMQVFSLWMSMTFRVQILISHCNYQIIKKFKPNSSNPPPPVFTWVSLLVFNIFKEHCNHSSGKNIAYFYFHKNGTWRMSFKVHVIFHSLH